MLSIATWRLPCTSTSLLTAMPPDDEAAGHAGACVALLGLRAPRAMQQGMQRGIKGMCVNAMQQGMKAMQQGIQQGAQGMQQGIKGVCVTGMHQGARAGPCNRGCRAYSRASGACSRAFSRASRACSRAREAMQQGIKVTQQSMKGM